MKETNGTVMDIRVKDSDRTYATVDYQVNGNEYSIKELLKMESTPINVGMNVGSIAIGSNQRSKVECQIGDEVIVVYNEKHPEIGHIKGNE